MKTYAKGCCYRPTLPGLENNNRSWTEPGPGSRGTRMAGSVADWPRMAGAEADWPLVDQDPGPGSLEHYNCWPFPCNCIWFWCKELQIVTVSIMVGVMLYIHVMNHLPFGVHMYVINGGRQFSIVSEPQEEQNVVGYSLTARAISASADWWELGRPEGNVRTCVWRGREGKRGRGNEPEGGGSSRSASGWQPLLACQVASLHARAGPHCTCATATHTHSATIRHVFLRAPPPFISTNY